MCVPQGFYHRYVVCLILQANLDNLKYYNVQVPDAGVNIARFSLWKQMFDGLQISSFQGKLGPNSLNVWVLVDFASMGVSPFTKALWMCCFEKSSGAEKPPMSTIFKHPVLSLDQRSVTLKRKCFMSSWWASLGVDPILLDLLTFHF